MRAVRPGQLAELERRHSRHGGRRPRALPFTDTRYRTVAGPQGPSEEHPEQANTRGEWMVFEFTHDSRAHGTTAGQMLFHPDKLKHRDERPVAFSQGPEVSLGWPAAEWQASGRAFGCVTPAGQGRGDRIGSGVDEEHVRAAPRGTLKRGVTYEHVDCDAGGARRD